MGRRRKQISWTVINIHPTYNSEAEREAAEKEALLKYYKLRMKYAEKEKEQQNTNGTA